jgi:integrase
LNGEVQARLGHGSIKTTLDVYAHLMPGLGAQLDEASSGRKMKPGKPPTA